MFSPNHILITELHRALVNKLERVGALEIRRETVRPYVLELVLKHSVTQDCSLDEQTKIVEQVLDRVFGLGVLAPLFQDPEITEIMVNGFGSVYVERNGLLERTDILFANEDEILQLINRIVGAAGRRIDGSSPLVDARLPDGSRVNAIIPPLSRVGPVITIRRFPVVAYTMQKLLAAGTASPGMAAFLRAAVAAKQNILISGSTGAGKTSTLNALAAEVGDHERLITIEDTAEIRLVHAHLVALEARQPNSEGVGEITIRTLLKNALRMRPDRILVGEVRGGEALDMLQAMNTGHQGSITTIHANAPEEALLRLETMALMTDLELPLAAIREQIKSAIQIVIQQERMPDGSRKIVAVSEMSTTKNYGATYELVPLFLFDKVTKRFKACNQLPLRAKNFVAQGVGLDPAWFLN